MGSRLHETFAKAYQDGTSPPERPRNIDPKAPIASLAAGPQQFTAIADTNHGSGKIIESLAQEIPRLAQTGVKHLMLELHINPVESPYRNMIDQQIENILTRINSRPPTITEREILAQSPLFKSAHEKTETNETGTAYAHLFIAAMNHGIIVHFAGDGRGVKESMKVSILSELYQKYLEEHKETEILSQKLSKDPDSIKKLNLPQTAKDQLENSVKEHHAWLDAYDKIWSEAVADYLEKRMGQDAENERASRFISLAQGEKSVVVFGQDHFRKKCDLNEAIDNQLKSQALAKGLEIPEKTPVVEIWDSRAAKWLKQSKEDKNIFLSPSLRIFADIGAVEIPKEFAQVYTFGAVTPQHPAQNAPSSANAPRP